MASKKLSNTLKLLLKTGFTVLLVWLVFKKIDFNQVSDVILASNPFYLLAALVLYAGSQVISSWRLLGFLLKLKIPITFAFNLRLYLLGMFYNVFLPGGVGGDGYKIYLLRKKFGTPTRSLLLAMLLDRATGLWAISMLAAGCLLLLPALHVVWPGWYPVLEPNGGAAEPLIPSGYIVLASAGFWLLWRLFFRTFLQYFPGAVVRALIVQSIQSAAVLLILRALHVETSLWPYLFSFLLATIATVIPLSVGGLGLREYVMLQLSVMLSIDGAVAVSTSLLFYVISTVAAMPGIWFVYRSKEFGQRAELVGDSGE